jgi:hypothetical protein
MLVALVAIAFVGGCERGGSSIDRRFVGRWLFEPARSDERVSAAELDLRSDGTYRLSLTVDGQANLLENRWTSEGVKVLLGFPADNTGDERHINAHGAEMRWPGADRGRLRRGILQGATRRHPSDGRTVRPHVGALVHRPVAEKVNGPSRGLEP